MRESRIFWWVVFSALFLVWSCGRVSAGPGDPDEPVRYVGTESANTAYHDGRLRPAVGVKNYEVMHSNRSHPEWSDGYGWTYNHAPMLAYWGGKFYLEYLSNPVGEHYSPGQTYVCTSTDGINWSFPEVVFPPYSLPEIGEILMHQRMGFYVAPNGRLLVLGFYGIPTGPSDSPNTGNGVGRVVREIYADGLFGPIYFIRYNTHCGFDQSNTDYPFYTSSDDQGFKDACKALLANKLMTQQWWEEDRSEDGFYAVSGSGGFSCKALSFWHRADGAAVGIWKEAWAALTWDEGQSWSTPVQCPTIAASTSKHWGQRTDDGRYVLVYNPVRGPRWPLIVTTGDDGIIFDSMLVVHGDIPPRRRAGRYKDAGAQYVRGICEGNGNPPGDDLWVTYSYNKEDIWVSRIPVPIRCEVNEPVSDNFEDMTAGGVVTNWNIYSPKWAPVAVAESGGGKYLRLKDESPYDYAKAVRVFPESSEVKLSFKVRPEQTSLGRLEIEVVDKHGERPVHLELDDGGKIMAQDGGSLVEVGSYQADRWYAIEIGVDLSSQRYGVVLDSNQVLADANLMEFVTSVERVEFRTGAYRLADPLPGAPGSDLPNPDDPVPMATFDIDDVLTADHVPYEPCEPEGVVEITYVSTGRPYVLGVAAVGERHYIDRDYFITEIGAELNNREMIRTSNEDDYVSTEDHLRFVLSRAATVYVVYDSRAEGNVPGWMSDWILTGEQVVTTDLYPDPLPYNVYSKSFAAGEVTLGGNDRTATGARANYFVIIRPYPVGDLNIDCCVDFRDYGLFASEWRQTGCTAYDWCGGADLDKSGDVGSGDLGMLAEHWLEVGD